MEFKDYYKIMGVARDATQDEIKRTYRKLARKYHPDVSKEANAEARFKELGEAYEVLKDAEKRAAYDQLGTNYKGGQDFRPPPDWNAGFEFSGGRPGGGDGAGPVTRPLMQKGRITTPRSLLIWRTPFGAQPAPSRYGFPQWTSRVMSSPESVCSTSPSPKAYAKASTFVSAGRAVQAGGRVLRGICIFRSNFEPTRFIASMAAISISICR
jgi:curved DNA-binding protein CbpA